MAKPTDKPVWATDANLADPGKGWNGTPSKVEPPAGIQAQGFKPRRRPPAQYLNWLFNLIYQWINWLDGATSAKWKWVNAAGLTAFDEFISAVNISAAAGTVGESATARCQIDLPEGARLLKIGVRIRHAAGEPAHIPGTNTGNATLFRVAKVADGVGGSPTLEVVKADPPDANFPATVTISLIPNNGAGELWETYIVDLDQDDAVVIDSESSWVINVSISGAKWIGAVGYQYRIDS